MKRDIFKKRINFKPYEYPEIIDFKDAIRHSYWLVEEFNFTADIQDFKTNINDSEREIITRAMLAISQIEVTVKRFWADIYNYFPKPEIDMVGVSFAESECYSEDTEILTEKGWVPFPLLGNERVATYSPHDKTIRFEYPLDYICKDYNGIMHLYESKQTNLFVTERHELYLKNNHTEAVSVRPSNEINSISNYTYPTSGYGVGPRTSLTDLERLLIAIQADGTVFANCPSLRGTGTTRISFTLSKSRKIYRLKEILDKLEIDYQVHQRNGQSVFTFSFKELANLFDLTQLKSFGWIQLPVISKSWGEEFLYELSHWDCHTSRQGSYSYYNSNLEALNKVQAIMVLSGHRSILSVSRTAEESMLIPNPDGNVRKTSQTNYRLNILEQDFTTYPEKTDYMYNGKVYCVTVSTGMIVTRRNGRVSINRNCRHADSYSNLLELLGLNEMFEHIHEYPALQARVDYVESFMNRKNLNHQGFVLSLTLFSLFIEHISLFSQFYIMMSFNKFKNLFKGISNAVEATSKEEEIHGRFGIALYNIIKEEQPKMFDQEFYKDLVELAEGAFSAEMQIIDWIYESGDLSFASKDVVKNYISSRYNNSMNSLGIDYKFPVDEKMLEETAWFDHEILTSKEIDFFNKRSIDYSKRGKAITADDLF